jgi:hypothetical protein
VLCSWIGCWRLWFLLLPSLQNYSFEVSSETARDWMYLECHHAAWVQTIAKAMVTQALMWAPQVAVPCVPLLLEERSSSLCKAH